MGQCSLVRPASFAHHALTRHERRQRHLQHVRDVSEQRHGPPARPLVLFVPREYVSAYANLACHIGL
jgi:hypothetical protein